MENAFYKLDGQTLLFGTIITNENYLLLLDEKDSYDLPIDGWYYFDTKLEAKEFFNIIPE